MGGRITDEKETSEEEEFEKNREWLERRRNSGVIPYAIEVEGRYIGDIDVGIYPNRRRADLTVFLGDRGEWGKGYGTEAVELVIGELLTDERVEVIEVDVVSHNHRALAFWKKLGFVEYAVDEQGTRFLRRYRCPSSNTVEKRLCQ